MTQSVTLEVVRIGRIRLMVTVLLGVTTVCLGAAVLLSAGVGSSWAWIEGLVYLMIAGGCFATSATTFFGFTRTAEALLLLTAYCGTAGVVIAGAASTALLAGATAQSVIVLLPGIAISSGSGRNLLLLSAAVYVASVMVRLVLRVDDPPSTLGELMIKMLVPVIGFGLVWVMARTLTMR